MSAEKTNRLKLGDPEPWSVDNDETRSFSYQGLIDASGKVIALAVAGLPGPRPAPDHGRRLVAAWNVCDHMKLAAIEELAEIGGVPALIVYGQDVRAERDALRERLQALVDAIKFTPLGVRQLQELARAQAALMPKPPAEPLG